MIKKLKRRTYLQNMANNKIYSTVFTARCSGCNTSVASSCGRSTVLSVVVVEVSGYYLEILAVSLIFS
jgi:hypothetical protein